MENPKQASKSSFAKYLFALLIIVALELYLVGKTIWFLLQGKIYLWTGVSGVSVSTYLINIAEMTAFDWFLFILFDVIAYLIMAYLIVLGYTKIKKGNY